MKKTTIIKYSYKEDGWTVLHLNEEGEVVELGMHTLEPKAGSVKDVYLHLEGKEQISEFLDIVATMYATINNLQNEG